MLSGLLADSATTSARLLQANGVIQDIETNERSFEFHENLEFSNQSKFVLELALQVVRLQEKKSIGTEHLLWGLIRLAETDKTVWSRLFQDHTINIKALNDQLTETI